MLNQIILVGKVVTEPQQTNTITLAVPRSYKNEKGVYETDFIDCVIPNYILSNAIDYLNKGDVVGIKGRLKTRMIDTEHKVTEVICEKMTFLSSHKPTEKDDNIMNKGEI